MQSRCSFENWYLYSEYEKHSIVCTSALMIVLFSRDSIVKKKNFGLRIKLYFLLQIPPMGKCGKMSSNDIWPNLHWQHCKRRKIPDNNGLPVVRQRKHSWFRIVSKRISRKLFNFFFITSSSSSSQSWFVCNSHRSFPPMCMKRVIWSEVEKPMGEAGRGRRCSSNMFYGWECTAQHDTKSSHFFPHS